MDNRILLAGAAVVVVGAAAFGGGYYINHGANPPPPAVTAPAPAEAPMEQAAAPVSEPVPAAPVAAQPVVKKRRLPDYANGETAYGPPPPPPPPPRQFEGPNPFESRFATFPMRHSGSGTLASPLTWAAQTELGHGREADLRVSVVVPMPPPGGDNGVLWSKWGARGNDDVMPEITRGTPVVVAASASVVVAIDPQFLDLDAPAMLSVNGRDGQRVYRSRDVAPARGESWDAEGARWIFQPDADFFRLMRDGAEVSVSFRSRMSQNPVTVPFATDDFPPSLNGFERDLYARMPVIAAAWGRSRPGAPPPPPPQQQQYYPPQPNGPFGGPGNPPPRGPAPPQYGPQPENGPPHDWQSQNGWQRGPQGGPQQQASTPPNAPAASAPVVQPAPQAGNGRAQGDHAHDHSAATAPSAPIAPPTAPAAPAAQKPHAPPAAATPANAPPPPAPRPLSPVTPPARPVVAQNPAVAPARPVFAPRPAVAPPPPRAAAANPGAVMVAAEIAAYRPPTDDCGPQPPVPQTPGPSPERKQANIWLKCRAHWMETYKKSVNMLNRDAAKAGAPLATVSGGNAIIAAFETSQGEFNAQRAAIKP